MISGFSKNKMIPAVYPSGSVMIYMISFCLSSFTAPRGKQQMRRGASP